MGLISDHIEWAHEDTNPLLACLSISRTFAPCSKRQGANEPSSFRIINAGSELSLHCFIVILLGRISEHSLFQAEAEESESPETHWNLFKWNQPSAALLGTKVLSMPWMHRVCRDLPVCRARRKQETGSSQFWTRSTPPLALSPMETPQDGHLELHWETSTQLAEQCWRTMGVDRHGDKITEGNTNAFSFTAFSNQEQPNRQHLVRFFGFFGGTVCLTCYKSLPQRDLFLGNVNGSHLSPLNHSHNVLHHVGNWEQ